MARSPLHGKAGQVVPVGRMLEGETVAQEVSDLVEVLAGFDLAIVKAERQSAIVVDLDIGDGACLE